MSFSSTFSKLIFYFHENVRDGEAPVNVTLGGTFEFLYLLSFEFLDHFLSM